MKISQVGIDLIKNWEGLRLEAYDDGAGIWTIGYGHTGPDVQPGMTITEAEADALLRQDLDRFERAVNEANTTSINQPQFDALVSLAFNIGAAAIKRSTAIKRNNKRDFYGAAEAITWWNKVGNEVWLGLVRRRAAEADLYLTDLPVDGADETPGAGVTPEENKPRRDNPIASRTVEGAVVAGAGGAAGAGAAMMGDDDESADDDTTPPTDETDPTDTADPAEPAEPGEPTDETTTIEQPTDTFEEPDKMDYVEAFQIAAGVIVVLAVLYIIFARLDDWFNWRR